MTEGVDAHGHVWTTDAEYPWVNQSSPGGVESAVYSLGDYREEMAAIAERSNTYVKVTHTPSETFHPLGDIHAHIEYLLETFGTCRLVWGSDYIYHFKKTTPPQTRSFLDECSLSTGDRRRLFGRTMAGLLP